VANIARWAAIFNTNASGKHFFPRWSASPAHGGACSKENDLVEGVSHLAMAFHVLSSWEPKLSKITAFRRRPRFWVCAPRLKIQSADR
jgi:hypothetical protein